MIFKVVVLKRTKKDELEAFTYNLQEGNYCSRNASSIRSLGYCPDIDETLFPDKIQDNYGNCTVHVALREEVPYVLYNNTEYVKYLKTGAEQYVLETIAQKLRFNFKYKFISPNEAFGVIFPNRTGIGLLSYLQRHEANVVAGGLFLSGDRLELFDYVYGYSFAIFSVITPTLLEKRWSRVYKQFGVITWFLIIVSFFFMLLVILITKALTTGKSEDEFLTTLKLWRYFYGQADIGLFKDRYLKRFLIVWIVFTSSIYAFYNTASYSLITAHVQDKIKINYSNIAALPFKPCVSNNTRYYFHSVYNERFPKNDDEYDAQCQNTDMVFNKVAMRTDLYTVEPDYTYYLRAVNYLDSEGQPTINKWDYPRTDILSIYLTKGFPLTKNFQKYAIRIYETGLLQRHLSYIYSRKTKPLPSLKKKYNVIRLEDFKIHYSVLLIGTLISFICFIIELKTGNK
ncbi:uncharacterized protein [Epargyreus clarus]|uniref:uncharacterized protein n=1 Tax=Epargyreus clarus TaxID=520877 RepID=UPI003C2B6625